MQTNPGGFLTFLICIVITMFTMVKFDHLTSKYNPNMSSYLQDIEPGTRLNLKEKGFRFAFTIEDYYEPKQLKKSPAYVKWLIRFWGKKGGVPFERNLKMHMCTDEDYAEFYPISEASDSNLEEIRNDPERGFYCPDWNAEDDYEIYGQEIDDDYKRLEVIFMPCN